MRPQTTVEWLEEYTYYMNIYNPELENDMKTSELSESKYLKKEDVMPAISVTIAGINKENLARDGEIPEMKFILNFEGDIKPMVLNPTNGALIEHILGDDEMDNWTGKKITLYNDPSVSYGGKLTGGIRVQIPQERPEMRSENPADF